MNSMINSDFQDIPEENFYPEFDEATLQDIWKRVKANKEEGLSTRLAARGLPPNWTEEELRRQGHTLDQGYWESEGVYRPGEDEEARTPRAAWSAAQTL